MATIGSFKKVGNDFQGEIITLSLQAKGVRIVAESDRQEQRRCTSMRSRTEIHSTRSRCFGEDNGRSFRSSSDLPRADLREPVRRRG